MEELTQTANAQLATFVLGMVGHDAVERLNLFPGRNTGHSLRGVRRPGGVRRPLLRRQGPAWWWSAAWLMRVAADSVPGTMAALHPLRRR